MTSPTKDQDKFEAIIDSHLAELMAMSDEEVLDGADPEATRAAGIKLLDEAMAEAGRRRLKAAREKHDADKSPAEVAPPLAVSVLEARAFLRAASNDSRYTMAARDLGEMSDEDALRLYRQLKELQNADDQSPDET